MCGGRGDIQQVQRSFLGQVMTSRPCPQCHGFGVTIPHPCLECSGDGRIQTRRTVTVKIPQGVDTGTRIQLAGQGEVGFGGGPPADLYLEVLVLAHPAFERLGDDLHCTVTIPMTAATIRAARSAAAKIGHRRDRGGAGAYAAGGAARTASSCRWKASVFSSSSGPPTYRREPPPTISGRSGTSAGGRGGGLTERSTSNSRPLSLRR